MFIGREEQLKLLDLCHKYGIKAQVTDPRIWRPDMSSPTLREDVFAAVKEYKDHPALWGYHIVDEPFPPKFHDWAKITAAVREADPDHFAFINMHCYGVTFVFRDQFDRGDHERYIDELMTIARPNILSYDQYILMADRKDDRIEPYFMNLDIIRAAALKYDVPFNSIILNTQHWKYRDPSDDDIRWQVYTSLAYGSKGIIYFTYAVPTGDPAYTWGDALIDREGNKTRRYFAAQKLNREIKEIGGVLLGLNSVGVFHTGDLPLSTKPVPAENLIQVTGGDFILGQFTDGEGAMYAMVTNKSMKDKQTAYLKFTQSVRVREVKPHGGFGRQTGSDKWQKTLNPGDGALLRIETGDPLYARWDYNADPMPVLSISAPDKSSEALAEEIKAKLFGKVNVFVLGSDCEDPAHTARRLRSDAYIILGDNGSYFVPFGMDMSKKLASAIDSTAKEDAVPFGDMSQIFCPAAIVKVDDADVLAKGIIEYFKK